MMHNVLLRKIFYTTSRTLHTPQTTHKKVFHKINHNSKMKQDKGQLFSNSEFVWYFYIINNTVTDIHSIRLYSI